MFGFCTALVETDMEENLIMIILLSLAFAGFMFFGVTVGIVTLLLKLVFRILFFVSGLYLVLAVLKKLAKL